MLPTKTDWQGCFIFRNMVHQTQQHSKHIILLFGVRHWQCWQHFQSVRADRKMSLKNFPRELNSRLAWSGLGHNKSAYRTRSIAPACGFHLGKFFPLQMQAAFTYVSYLSGHNRCLWITFDLTFEMLWMTVTDLAEGNSSPQISLSESVVIPRLCCILKARPEVISQAMYAK